ncbi:uncharacterized protein LOC123556712 [Mercenaria mercenaria]|uniref:uncharacterized protein LOC123556712 n=1 Tax=Mercenaria mercenaria TaxID=6596 RepID=UPI00234E5C9A|nr:uncharacterized protein LOC123556712 [Mercenaria mercenaria]
MKFYIHSEDPELTVVMVWEKDKAGTIQDVLNTFIESLKLKFPVCNTPKLLCTVKNGKGKVIDKSSAVGNVVKHMDDLHVKVEFDKGEIGVSVVEDTATTEHKKQAKDSQSNKDILLGKNNAAIIHVGNNRYRKAIEIYKEMLKVDSKNKSAYNGLVTCYKKAGRYQKGLSWAKKALKLFENDVELHILAGEAYIGCGNGDEAIEILIKCSKLARSSGGLSTEHKHEIQVLLAKAYLIKEQRDMAIAVLQGVLRENIEHQEALVEYAGLLFPLGPSQKEEAMSVLLTVLARNKNDKNAVEKLADVCQQPGGMEVLKEVAGPVIKDSAALVFLGNCLRDCSAMEECLQLFHMALDVEPSNPSIALIYVHTLEVVERHDEIIKYYKEYCSQFLEKSVNDVTCSEVSDIIHSIPEKLEDRTEGVSPWKLGDNVLAKSSMGEYTDEEKYLLAFWFTLVKVLFVKGQLQYIPPLLEMLQPLCEGRDLHLSNIRNEAAYFNCIRELFKTYGKIPSTKLSHGENYIYFIGDSHCIPPAWQKITVQDATFIVLPVLSTGTKIWHLRSESKFYPKVNFYSAIRNIPDNSTVVVCLGEIDCREALLKCWEKARYDTIEDGMETVIDIYLQVLKSLQSKHQWKIFIHPVLPVLDVTRPIVLQFNRILATMLLREPTIHWLNFVNELLTGPEEEKMLKEEFRLDGTHLHPRYVSVLAESLSQYSGIFN